MSLVEGKSLFISETDVVLRAAADHRSDAENHLIFGDWLRYLGEEDGDWAKVRCRGDTGWLLQTAFSEERILEVNFVDIGQGDGCHIVTPEDEIMLVDAGEGDNMYRFLSWRYNLRGRKVAGVEGVAASGPDASPPLPIHHVVVSHPDMDHYYGFGDLFDSKKVEIRKVYHSSIVERPISSADQDPDLRYYSGGDLGGYVTEGDAKYLWDVVTTDAAMHELIEEHATTQKKYLSTLRKARENNASVEFVALTAADDYVEGFTEADPLTLKVLGPVTEAKTHGTETRPCLLRLGDDGVTKNGHSVILQLRIGKLRVMLGGDLNTESEDYLLQHYCESTDVASELEAAVLALEAKGSTITSTEQQELAEARAALDLLVTKGRAHFQVDVTKACHHGSHHFSETFLRVLNAIVTVISSGDDENYAHPRPDALGAFGRYGRGVRPLIFSTELARNTREFVRVYDYYAELRAYEARIEAATTASERNAIEKEMEEKKDRNVAVYGMITLRTDGEKVVFAQKLETSGGADNKWDIHELTFNQHTGAFEYRPSAKEH